MVNIGEFDLPFPNVGDLPRANWFVQFSAMLIDLNNRTIDLANKLVVAERQITELKSLAVVKETATGGNCSSTTERRYCECDDVSKCDQERPAACTVYKYHPQMMINGEWVNLSCEDSELAAYRSLAVMSPGVHVHKRIVAVEANTDNPSAKVIDLV